MTSLTTVPRPLTTLREMARFDVPRLVRVADQTLATHQTTQGLLTALQTGGGAVAEHDEQALGFVIYQVTPPPSRGILAALKEVSHWCRVRRRGAPSTPRHVDLLLIAVLPEWRRQGIGRALLERVHRTFRRSGDHLRAVIPETNLPVQLLLRDAGYKAVQVVAGYYGNEDGYVMEHTAD